VNANILAKKNVVPLDVFQKQGGDFLENGSNSGCLRWFMIA
jgi:hypothetical protein